MAPAVFGQGVQRYTLEDALQRAPKANFDLLLSAEQIETSVQAQRRARADLLPQVTADASQTRSQNYFNFGSGTSVATVNSFSALLRARLSIFDFNTHSDYRVAKFNTEIARLELDQTAEDIRQAIAQLFFDHQRNLRQAAAIRSQIERDQTLFDIASRRLEAGSATQLDATRAEVRLAASELSLIQLETQIFQSETNFKRALDLDFDRPLELAAVDLDMSALLDFDYGRFERVLQSRPEVVTETRRLERNRLAKKAADYQWLPSVELSGAYGRAADVFDDPFEEIWSVGVTVSVPIFEGFRLDANQAEAASAVRGQTIALASIEKQIEAEYRVAINQVATAVKSIALARRQVTLAELELELAQNRFEEGVANNSEVVEAQASLATAEDGLVAAEYQYQLTRLALARAEGDVLSLVR
tara:strand:- start:2701 stop:3951 length:1251 start_codon:yes stop_codon:yes gene_type:complete